MLYIGHFYFIAQVSDQEEFCGRFTCLAKAEDVSEAVQKFRDHLWERIESGGLFDGNVSVYLDDLIELNKEPENAIAFNFRSLPDLTQPSTVCPLLSVDSEECRVHEWSPHASDQPNKLQPNLFMDFESPKNNHKGRHLRLIKGGKALGL